MNLVDETRIPFFQVDAFTEKPFRGNPAAVCLMPCNLDDSIYQSIAHEMNLSETAFVEQLTQVGAYKLRWFTPKIEVPFCGHATLATSHILYSHIGVESELISFNTLSGVFRAERVEEGIRLDFPRNDPVEVMPPEPMLKALGLSSWMETRFSEETSKLLVRLETQKQVLELQPNFTTLEAVENRLGVRGVIVTSVGSGTYDFVSRYFAPWVGVNEDPVTGSAHTVLAPYWWKQLGKRKMFAYQASDRGGELQLELAENRVYVIGKAVTVIEGFLNIDTTQ